MLCDGFEAQSDTAAALLVVHVRAQRLAITHWTVTLLDSFAGCAGPCGTDRNQKLVDSILRSNYREFKE